MKTFNLIFLCHFIQLMPLPSRKKYFSYPQKMVTGGYFSYPQKMVTGGYFSYPQKMVTGGYFSYPQKIVTGGPYTAICRVSRSTVANTSPNTCIGI